MEKIILKAMTRTEKLNDVRKAGFIPGVLNGPGPVSVSVKFEIAALNKIITKHGSNAKIWIELDAEKSFGYIKEIQKNSVEGKILHVAIQLVAKGQEVKMQLPIIFHGVRELETKSLQMQVCKSEIEVFGKATLMPDETEVDVSKKESGENVTAIDFHLPSGITIVDSEDEIFAVIKNVKVETVEKPEEEEIEPAAE